MPSRGAVEMTALLVASIVLYGAAFAWSVRAMIIAAIAQQVERPAHNRREAGSSPVSGTIFHDFLRSAFARSSISRNKKRAFIPHSPALSTSPGPGLFQRFLTSPDCLAGQSLHGPTQ